MKIKEEIGYWWWRLKALFFSILCKLGYHPSCLHIIEAKDNMANEYNLYFIEKCIWCNKIIEMELVQENLTYDESFQYMQEHCNMIVDTKKREITNKSNIKLV